MKYCQNQQVAIIINYINSISAGSPPSDPPYNATYEIFADTNNGPFQSTEPNFVETFIKKLSLKISSTTSSVHLICSPGFFVLRYSWILQSLFFITIKNYMTLYILSVDFWRNLDLS